MSETEFRAQMQDLSSQVDGMRALLDELLPIFIIATPHPPAVVDILRRFAETSQNRSGDAYAQEWARVLLDQLQGTQKQP